MELGMIGLGRMGGNMAEKLLKGGHQVVGYARDKASVERLKAQGGTGAYSLVELAKALAKPEDVVYGQYVSGKINGKDVLAYRKEPGVPPESKTPTFVAMRVKIANLRWQGVPFYLRTGKRLKKTMTQIVINFHEQPLSLFHTGKLAPTRKPNVLVINIQPDEGFDLHFKVKSPGERIELTDQRLHFKYSEVFGPHIHESYETLLLDIIRGDQTLFVRSDEVEEAWRLYMPLFDKEIPVHPYEAGSWGPGEADHLPDEDGSIGWLNP